jgi:hypothetical protein
LKEEALKIKSSPLLQRRRFSREGGGCFFEKREISFSSKEEEKGSVNKR